MDEDIVMNNDVDDAEFGDIAHIADEDFRNAGNDFEALMDEDSSDEELHPLSDDSDYASDCSDDSDDAEIINKVVSASELRALNANTKHCAIYFYYSTGGALAVCATCMIQLTDVNLGSMHAVVKHEIKAHDALGGRWCSNCRDPLHQIYPSNVCPMCVSVNRE